MICHIADAVYPIVISCYYNLTLGCADMHTVYILKHIHYKVTIFNTALYQLMEKEISSQY